MSALAPPAGINEQDYETIEDAVMETARGRWFLREYARRIRAADTNRLIEAMSRIERVLSGQASLLEDQFASAAHVGAIEERRDQLAQLATGLREQGYDGDLCARIEREANGLSTLIEDMRRPAAAMENAPGPMRPEPPQALRPVTIEAHAVEPQTSLPAPDRPAAPAADLSALAAVDALPAAEKLALFS